MRWETISTNSRNEVYELRLQDQKLLTLTLHPFSHTGRIESENEKRVFLIRKEGFLRNKTVLRNEYGIKIGELGLENKENFIEVFDQRFYYSIDQGPSPHLVLYKKTADHPSLICELNIKGGNASVHLDKAGKLDSHPELLVAMCWYMFLPVARKNLLEQSQIVA